MIAWASNPILKKVVLGRRPSENDLYSDTWGAT
jgi:hypothetical protein